MARQIDWGAPFSEDFLSRGKDVYIQVTQSGVYYGNALRVRVRPTKPDYAIFCTFSAGGAS